MKRTILIFGFFLLLAQCFLQSKTMAQTAIETKIDPTQIVIGDQARLFISATVDSTKSQLRWAAIPDTFNTLEIVEKGKIDTTRNSATINLRQRLLITGFDSGSFLIPRFSFLSINKNGTTDTLFTDSFRIAVSTIAVDTSKAFKDIKTIATVASSWTDYLPQILGGIIAIALLVGIIVYLIERRKKKGKIVAEERAETYHERAIRLLTELDKKQLWQQNKPKEYYTELSEIVRQYIELRFNTNAMELTTDELLQKAKKHREMVQYRKSLKPLLQAADLAKFAKANPLPEEHIEALELALQFVRISKPKPQPPIENQ